MCTFIFFHTVYCFLQLGFRIFWASLCTYLSIYRSIAPTSLFNTPGRQFNSHSQVNQPLRRMAEIWFGTAKQLCRPSASACSQDGTFCILRPVCNLFIFFCKYFIQIQISYPFSIYSHFSSWYVHRWMFSSMAIIPSLYFRMQTFRHVWSSALSAPCCFLKYSRVRVKGTRGAPSWQAGTVELSVIVGKAAVLGGLVL